MQRASFWRIGPVVLILILASSLAGIALAAPAHVSSAPTTTISSHTGYAASAAPGVAPAKLVSPGASAEARLQAAIKAAHVDPKTVFPPNLLYAPKFHNGMIVGPLYPQAPEPVGVADYGVDNATGTPVSYTYDTTGFLANVTLDSVTPYYLATGTAGGFTSQLNVVLNNVTLHGVSGYTFWNQNVFVYDAIGHTMLIENNIWNFSAPVGPQPVSTFYKTMGYTNGTDVPSVGYYFAQTPNIIVQTPFIVEFTLHTLTHGIGTANFTEVDFGYNVLNATTDAKISGYVYDRVLFNNSGGSGSIPQAQYHVDGTNLTPTGFIPYDAEVMLGGPGGGSTATFNAINGTMTLEHLNPSGSAYVPERAAWSSGSETGETAVGVAEYYDAQHVVHLGGGPEFIQPMWNSSPTAVAGAATLTGTITPSNAWAFVSPNAYSVGTAAWAPLPTSGTYTWNLEAGSYSVKLMLSNYALVQSTPMLLSPGSPTTYTQTLLASPSAGIYTPLYAWSNSQLASISMAGAGTLANPYLIANNEFAPLADEFATYNDYGFQSYPGISIGDTSAYAVILNPAPFTVNYWGPYLNSALNFFHTPPTNSLGIWLYGTSHISVIGGSEQGWFGSFQSGFTYANVILWNSTSDLINGVTFSTVSDAIFDYGGTNNTIAGNWFVPSALQGPFASALIVYLGAFYVTGVPIALSQNEGGDLIFNNYVDTPWTAYESTYNVFDGLWPTVFFPYANNWNLSAPMASTAPIVVNGIPLSGSVVDGATVCGNFWNNYIPGTTTVPYNNTIGINWISTGGDFCPVGMPPPNGHIAGTVTPASATVLVDGVPVSVVGGAFNVVATATGSGVHSLEATASGYYPYYNNVSVSGGATTRVAITLTPVPAPMPGTAVFAETGLPAGTSWSVTVGSGTPQSSTTGTISVSEAAGMYTYSVGSVTGFAATPGSGTAGVSAGGTTTVNVVFTGTSGYVAGTVSPSAATVLVDGTAVTTTNGAFNVSESAGLHSIRATASGYVTYVNNVTVSGGVTTHLTIALSTSGTSASSTGLSNTDLYAIVGGIVVLAAAIVIAAALIRSRRGGPPPAQAWSNPPSSGS